MRNLKKFLALVMAMVMAFSLMLSASAANPVKTFGDADQITEAFVEAADVLTGMKVFQGDEGGFRPADTINRAEVAALIYRLATGDTSDSRKDLYKDYGNFADVSSSDWFAGYVGYCANAGYIKGHGGYFNPYDSVTGYEALAMILRAVGYDKNGEFEGATWQTNVSALSTQLGILKQVKSTDYGDRLYEPSRRDVVASLLFETAAYVNMVEYTPMAGYNKYEELVGSTLRPTLGERYFGLTSKTGIVVGNQDTGEDYTKLGLELDNVNRLTGNPSYAYTTTARSNLTLSFNANTGIDMFGHKYKIWYDYNSWKTTENVTGSKFYDEFKTVYATFDKATLAQHVYATDADITSTANADGAIGLRSAAKNAGFANTAKTRWSVMYSRIDATADQSIDLSHQDTPIPNTVNAITPAASEVETYYLVSNNDDKTVDVAVNVYNELARIDKKDTTANTKTLTLGNTTGVTSQLGSTAAGGTLKESALTPNSEKNLGTMVLATNIIGTDNALADGVYGTHKEFQNYYKLENAITEENQIVASAYSTSTTNKWNNDQNDAISIDLADGTTLKRSGIITGASADGAAGSNTSHMISKCVTELTNANMIFGQNLTIYKDKTGRFIGVKTGTDFSFLYGTFADYEIGGLGTGTIKYAITGVNWDGEIVENHVMTSITAGDTTTRYRDNTLANGYSTNEITGDHFVMPLTKKYLADTAPGSGVGNQILAGRNMGLAIDSAGNVLAPVTATGTSNQQYNVVANGKTLAKYNSGADWTLTAADAANGFARVDTKNVPTDTAVSRLITNETKFIVVTGSGTADLKVDIYTGISEFLNGSTSVNINNNATGTTVDSTFYLTRADRYNNMDTTQNEIIDTVILSDTQISGRSTSSLYFSNSAVQTGTKLNGEYDQYVLYNDGVKGYYFIESVDGNTTSGTTNAPAADRFYTLRQTRTVNGQPVYAAQVVAAGTGGVAGDGVRTDSGNFCWANAGAADVLYSYVATSNLSTAYFGGTDAPDGTTGIHYSTNGTVYRVDNAKVVDLTNGTSTDNVPHAEFQSVQDLNNAVSSGWKIGDVAIVNSGLDVSIIYVLSVTST